MESQLHFIKSELPTWKCKAFQALFMMMAIQPESVFFIKEPQSILIKKQLSIVY